VKRDHINIQDNGCQGVIELMRNTTGNEKNGGKRALTDGNK